MGIAQGDTNLVNPVCNECVEASDSPVTDMNDKSGLTTSWTEVVSKRKKKPDGLGKKVTFPSSFDKLQGNSL